MQRFSYNYGENNLEVKVDTIHGFHVTLNILSAPWDFRLKRKGRADYKGPDQLPMLQWQLPEDCGVTIVMEPKPELKPVDGVIGCEPEAYSASPYRPDNVPVSVGEWLWFFDKFYMERKRWKRKTLRHANHLLAQGGWKIG